MSETLAESRIDEEDIRLTTGFADIFTAVLLVFGGSTALALAQAPGGLLIAVAAFLLAKPLVTDRRFAASANVLAAGAAIGTGVLFAATESILSLLPIAAACWGFWHLRRVPLALALAFCALAAFAVLLSASLDAPTLWGAALMDEGSAPLIAMGLILFVAAMVFDGKDRLRLSRQSDVAFWLHLASAPLFVHGFFTAMGASPFQSDPASPWLVFATFAALTLVSLAIDRRPLLASSFIYLVAATARLIGDAYEGGRLGDSALYAATAPAVIGILLLGLAAAWTPLRRCVLAPLPAVASRYLPPASGRTAAPPDEREALPQAETEPVRLVLGFNDFFVALGAAALFVGSVVVGGIAAMDLSEGAFAPGAALRNVGLAWIPVLIPAAAMWLVAEYFVRVRRMAWPAITAALSFALMALAAGVLAPLHLLIRSGVTLVPTGISDFTAPGVPLAAGCVILGCGTAFLANLAFWRRHRLPISFALAIAALLPLAFADVIVDLLVSRGAVPEEPDWALRIGFFGLACFALALAWDRSDPGRATQRADIAFWLHALASILIVPVAAHVLGGWTLVFLLALIPLALAIDRRAPVVVALPFVFSANADLLPGAAGAWASLGFVAALLALAFQWERVRQALLTLRPA